MPPATWHLLGITALVVGLVVTLIFLARRFRRAVFQDRAERQRPVFTFEELYRILQSEKATNEEFERIRKRALEEMETALPCENAAEFLTELKQAFERKVISEPDYRRLRKKTIECMGNPAE